VFSKQKRVRVPSRFRHFCGDQNQQDFCSVDLAVCFAVLKQKEEIFCELSGLSKNVVYDFAG
jgi:DNA-binding transcriptional regulator/RsmH inhibitor MraZ